MFDESLRVVFFELEIFCIDLVDKLSIDHLFFLQFKLFIYLDLDFYLLIELFYFK